ncbi:MAG: LacI family DNA-binding transcriptional regulator [Dehalococcoidia bacterium]
MVTIQDVARHAGVSVGTVSRVLNEHPTVRPNVRATVLESISELDYRPNSIARDLRRSRTRTIGLMVNDLNNPPSVALLRGTEDAAREAGYTVVIAESRSDIETEALNLKVLLERRVDALLCVPVHSVDALAERAEAAHVPLAILNQRSPHRRVATGYVDENAAIVAALECMTGLGHRRFAMLHPTGSASGRSRTERVRQYLSAQGFLGPSSGQLLWSFLDGDDCERLVTKLLTVPEAPTALVVGAHQYIPDVLRAVKAANKRIPFDVSVVAFGDSTWASAFSPSISVIAFDQRQHAIDTTRMLLSILDGESSTTSVPATAEFIQRESCAAPPADESG